MKHVLFVDDNPRVLDGLRDVLSRHRLQWMARFAPDAQSALETLAREPVDVVVCDLRMPGIGGATLLALVHAWHPEVGRVVLSGHIVDEWSERVAYLADVTLSKPCRRKELIAALERATRHGAAGVASAD